MASASSRRQAILTVSCVVAPVLLLLLLCECEKRSKCVSKCVCVCAIVPVSLLQCCSVAVRVAVPVLFCAFLCLPT